MKRKGKINSCIVKKKLELHLNIIQESNNYDCIIFSNYFLGPLNKKINGIENDAGIWTGNCRLELVK
jgi:hypothetical protein